MTDLELVKAAEAYARRCHAGQTDKCGVPYIEHPRTVASLLRDPKEKCVAWLHDTVEDSSATVEDIRSIFGDEIADAVELLTHDKSMPYLDYIKRLAVNPLARRTKMADLFHNMDESRFEGREIPGRLVWKRANCYLPAFDYLEQVGREEGEKERFYERDEREVEIHLTRHDKRTGTSEKGSREGEG